MIELRKYECMHVYRVRARSSKRTHIYDLSQSGGAGRVYEMKLRSNLAPEEGGGIYSRGRMIEQVRYNHKIRRFQWQKPPVKHTCMSTHDTGINHV